MTGPVRPAPGLLLIGAAGRNAGKTEFACAVVRHLARQHDVYAAKVTTVHAPGGPCPHGGSGCGVCTQLTAPFDLREERGEAVGKDTTRLLGSGARRVFWLRTKVGSLADGAAALLAEIPPGTLWVCESNSLRQVVEPDLFVLVRTTGDPTVKPSAATVATLVDREVGSDGRRFDPPPEAFAAAAGPRWATPLDAALIVLAGGRSRRMGRDKAMLPFGGRPLIAHTVDRLAPFFADVLVSVAAPGRYAFLGRRMVVDAVPEQGPLAGITAALAASVHDLNLVVPADAADFPPSLALRLLRAARQADAAVAQGPDGRPEPLCAVYRRHLLPRLQAGFAAGARAIRELYPTFDVRFVPLGDRESVHNINTPEDYARQSGGPLPSAGEEG